MTTAQRSRPSWIGAQRRAGDGPEVVVLDDEDVRRQRARAAACARAADSTAPVGFWPRGVSDDGARRRRQRVRAHPLRVEGDGQRRQPEGADDVDHRREAGVLHRHGVARRQLRGEDALDAVQATVDDGRLVVTDHSAQRGVDRVGAVQARRPGQPAQRRVDVGQQRGVGVARREVAHALGDGARRRHERGAPAGDLHAAARAGHDDAAAAQLGERARDRRRAHSEVGGQRAHRGQPRARLEPAVPDRRLDGGRDLPRVGPVIICSDTDA